MSNHPCSSDESNMISSHHSTDSNTTPLQDQWIAQHLEPDYNEYAVYDEEPAQLSSMSQEESSSLKNTSRIISCDPSTITTVLIEGTHRHSHQQLQGASEIEWRQEIYPNYIEYNGYNSVQHDQQGLPSSSSIYHDNLPLPNHHLHQHQPHHQPEDQHHQQTSLIDSLYHKHLSATSKTDISHTHCSEAKTLRPHSTPATLCWLDMNYELADGICIPRNVVYFNYVDFCSKNNMQPVNAASFGKIIRQMFQSLTTRRLGTRGQSRYHYFGLAIKPDSIYYSPNYSKKNNESYAKLKPHQYHHSQNSHQPLPIQQQPIQQYQGSDPPQHSPSNYAQIASTSSTSTFASDNNESLVDKYDHSDSRQNLLIDFAAAQKLPEFPGIMDLNACRMGNIDSSKLQTLIDLYRWHCQKILCAINRFSFSEIPHIFINFWKEIPPNLANYLGQNVVVTLIGVCDMILYRAILKVVLPTPFQVYPENLLKIVRKFSYDFISSLQYSLKNVSENLCYVKLKLARQTAKMLRRRTSVNHLYQASCLVGNSSKVYEDMKKDWKMIELDKLAEETSIKHCNYQHLKTYLCQFFKMIIDEKPTMDFCHWIDGVVASFISCKKTESIKIAAKKFISVWQAIKYKVQKDLKKLKHRRNMSRLNLMCLLINEVILHKVEKLIFEGVLKELSPKMLNAQPSELPEASFIDTLELDFLSKNETKSISPGMQSFDDGSSLSPENVQSPLPLPPPLKTMRISTGKFETSTQTWIKNSSSLEENENFSSVNAKDISVRSNTNVPASSPN